MKARTSVASVLPLIFLTDVNFRTKMKKHILQKSFRQARKWIITGFLDTYRRQISKGLYMQKDRIVVFNPRRSDQIEF